MDFQSYQHLEFERHGRVLTVFLNRPQAFNAVNGPLHSEISRLFSDIAADDASDVVVLSGRGPHFCFGGDVKWFGNMSGAEVDLLFREARTIIISMLELEKPVITAINGRAVGFGATLALFGDVIFAADDAAISDPHVSSAGVVAGDGAAVIWPWLIGMARAKEFLLTGQSIAAADAKAMGLVNHVVARDQLLSEATAFARRLASLPQLAVRGTKVSLNQILRDTANAVLDVSLAREKECFSSPDHIEAIQAFAEKRKPVFGKNRPPGSA